MLRTSSTARSSRGDLVNVQQFLREANGAPVAHAYLFCPFKAPGAKYASFEPVLADRAVDRIVRTHVDPSLKDLCFTTYYADEADPAEIAMEARTLPFLAERRVILVRGAEAFESESACKPLLAYLESPNDSTILLFVASRVDKRTKFYKACEATGRIIECPELREQEVSLWVQAEAQARGKTLEPGAVRELVARTGTRLSDVNNAIDLVCAYAGGAGMVTQNDVAAACADVAEEEIWALTDAIAASDPGRALTALRAILELGKSEFEIMGSINWLLKSAYVVAGDAPAKAQVKEYTARRVRPLAAKLGTEKLRDAFALCMDTELLLRTTGVDRALALEMLVVKLAAPRNHKRPANEK